MSSTLRASTTRQSRAASLRQASTGRGLTRVLSPALLLLTWEALSRGQVIDSRVLSAPSVVVARIVDLLGSGELLPHLQVSVVRFGVGLAVGAAVGTALGLTLGIFRTARAIINPLIAMLYPLPRIAMFPLILILMGFNERALLLQITVAPFFTMTIGSMVAVQGIDSIYRDVAKSFNTGTLDLYLRITLPAALPAIIGSLRISVGLALMSTIAVEFLAANRGLGYLIWHSWQIMSLRDTIAGMIVAGLLGTLAFSLVGILERYAVPWQARDS